MILRDRFHEWINGKLIGIGMRRDPDFVVGDAANPYLRRWWVIPRNPVLNIYLHQFLRDDDDRALHDHPWFWCSIILEGGYTEHTIAAGGVYQRRTRYPLSVRFGTPWGAHRIELLPKWWLEDDWDAACDLYRAGENDKAPCWTLFMTGPRMRAWGFHCPRGWVPWQRFTAPGDPGSIGPGCDDNPSALRNALATGYAAERAGEFRRIETEVESRCRMLPSGDIWNDYRSDLAGKMRALADLGRLRITATSASGAVCARWINPELPPSKVAANDNRRDNAALEG